MSLYAARDADFSKAWAVQQLFRRSTFPVQLEYDARAADAESLRHRGRVRHLMRCEVVHTLAVASKLTAAIIVPHRENAQRRTVLW